MIPDFGEHKYVFKDSYGEHILTCKYKVPGLTMHDLVMIHYNASHEDTNHLSGNPSKWPITKGVEAVVDAVLKAIYENDNK